MKRIILAALLLCIYATSFSQSGTALRIGDAVRINVNGLSAALKEALSFSTPGRKLTILDFWGTNCMACVAALPRMDTLQKRFGSQIRIVPVCKESNEKIKAFLKARRLELADLVMLTGDRELHALFPHNTVPHHVWIDEKGKVLFITDGYNSNATSIAQYLSGKKLQLEKKEDLISFGQNNGRSILSEPSFFSNLRQYSLIMGPTGQVNFATIREFKDSAKHAAGIQVINGTFLMLFQVAFGTMAKTNPFLLANRYVIETGDTADFNYPREEEISSWKQTHTLTYESLMPDTLKDQIYPVMQSDLVRMLPYTATVEKRMTKCLCLVRLNNDTRFMSPGGKKEIHFSPGVLLKNAPWSDFVQALKMTQQKLSTPIIDDTGYTGNVDLELNAPLKDLEALRNALRQYDLDIVERTKPIDILVIRKK